MDWEVVPSEEVAEFVRGLPKDDRIEVLAVVTLLRKVGPSLSRPHSDTLKLGRKEQIRNLKELRIPYDGKQYRILYAFDPKRRAILLVGGDKVPMGEKLWYEKHINLALEMFQAHLDKLRAEKTTAKEKKGNR